MIRFIVGWYLCSPMKLLEPIFLKPCTFEAYNIQIISLFFLTTFLFPTDLLAIPSHLLNIFAPGLESSSPSLILPSYSVILLSRKIIYPNPDLTFLISLYPMSFLLHTLETYSTVVPGTCQILYHISSHEFQHLTLYMTAYLCKTFA